MAQCYQQENQSTGEVICQVAEGNKVRISDLPRGGDGFLFFILYVVCVFETCYENGMYITLII